MNKDIDKKFRFRKFPVYIEGRNFVVELKKLMTTKFPKEERFELRSQLWRALDSFLLNIAEGCDRGTDRDFAKFLNQSHTSLNEVVACLDISLDNEYMTPEEHRYWLGRASGLVDQLTAFRKTLLTESKTVNQKSEVRGQRSEVQNGFTLIETLIYIAIIGGVVASFVSYSISISGSRNKTYVVQEVQANVRTAHDIIGQRIRAATQINTSTSVFDSDPGYLSLAMASSTLNPTIIGLSADNGVLQIKEGTSASTTITTDEVQVTNLVFTDLTASSTRENVRIQMTVGYNNAGGDVEFTYSQTVTSSVSVRQ